MSIRRRTMALGPPVTGRLSSRPVSTFWVGAAKRHLAAGLRAMPGGAALLALYAHLRRQASSSYPVWIARYDSLTGAERTRIRRQIEALAAPPTISILLPVYRPDMRQLTAAIASVRAQLYPHWQLCIADDGTGDADLAAQLQALAAADPRIRVTRRPDNGGIAAATNSALDLATGSHVSFLDQDDVLAETALYHLAMAFADDPLVRLAYGDEDKLADDGRRVEPLFKPDWNPELLLSQNYIAHGAAMSADLVRRLGGLRSDLDGAQDHDLMLRATEAIAADGGSVRHVPFILYHWRRHAGSTAAAQAAKPAAWSAGAKAVAEAMARRALAGRVEAAAGGSYYRPILDLAFPPRISVIVPTRDRAGLLRYCLNGLRHRTDYPDLEILIVDNGSQEPETAALLADFADDPRVRVLSRPGPFNFSALNNAAAAEATGELLLLLNNDVEPLEPGWLREMASHAVRPGVGAVGAKLLFPDGRIQHAGIATGIGRIAGHPHKFLPGDAPGYFGRAAVLQRMSAVTGACLLTRRDLYLALDGLDETDLPVAFNDVDYCLRLGAAGHAVLYTPFARLIHHESASRGQDATGPKYERLMREAAAMERRWGARLTADPYFSPNLSLDFEIPTLAFPPRVERPWA